MAVKINCDCGQWKGHPDAQSCMELHHGEPDRPPSGLYDGVIEVGNPDLVMAGYAGEGDSCDCICHEDER